MFTESIWKKSGLKIAGRKGHQQDAEEYCTKGNFVVCTLQQIFLRPVSTERYSVCIINSKDTVPVLSTVRIQCIINRKDTVSVLSTVRIRCLYYQQ